MAIQSNELKELRVAGILDELSCFCFPYECKFLELNIVNYIEDMEIFRPQLLFVESAWHGKRNQWYKKIYNLSIEIREILNWCDINKVPTVFWNKEDPIHFDTFLGIASKFDYVYTTDMDCVPLYKRLLKHNRVGVLPFAVSPYSFNPLEKYARNEKTCFAGNYYALQPERCDDFEKIFDLCSEISGVDIYDRNAYPGNPDYMFPDKYKGNIVGSLPMNKIDIAYKGYLYGITMNTVKYSSTMEARRIFELMACNTISLSNPCTAIKNLFGDLVIVWENEDQFKNELDKVKNIPYYREKRCLLALRKVMIQHTYEERMFKVCQDVFGWERNDQGPKICAFSVVKSNDEIYRVIKNWKRQNYRSELVLIMNHELKKDIEPMMDEDVLLIEQTSYTSIIDYSCADYYCYLSPNNYYGANYLTDLIVATKYAANPIIGKGSYFKNIAGVYSLENQKLAYSIINHLKGDRCIVQKHIAEYCYNKNTDYNNLNIEGFVGTSVDFFNFCENEYSEVCEYVEDCQIEEGYSIEEIYNICDALPNHKYYTMQERWTGKEFLRDAILEPRRLKYLEFQEEWGCLRKKISDGKVFYTQLTRNFEVKTYDIDKYIRIYIDGEIRGNASIVMHFLDNTGTLVRKSWPKMGMDLRIPIPENAESFYFSIALSDQSSILFKEIIINAFSTKNINLKDIITEG